MLCLGRREKEQIILVLPDQREITITVFELRGSKVKLSFDCPDDVAIHRGEAKVKTRLDHKQIRELLGSEVVGPRDYGHGQIDSLGDGERYLDDSGNR